MKCLSDIRCKVHGEITPSLIIGKKKKKNVYLSSGRALYFYNKMIIALTTAEMCIHNKKKSRAFFDNSTGLILTTACWQ